MSTIVSAIPNSTMHILTPECMGIDPGYTHVAVVIRKGNRALWATTLRRPEKHVSVNDVSTLAKWWLRACDEAVAAWKRMIGLDNRLHVAAEWMNAPELYIKGKPNKIGIDNWGGTYGMIGALVGRFPNIILVPPKKLSGAHLLRNGGTGNAEDYAPPELIGSNRPPTFGPNEHLGNERRDEQSAFAIAGRAAESISTIDLNWKDKL